MPEPNPPDDLIEEVVEIIEKVPVRFLVMAAVVGAIAVVAVAYAVLGREET